MPRDRRRRNGRGPGPPAPDGGVHQKGRPGGAQPPVDRSELVHQVAGLLAEETGETDLVLAEQVQANSQGRARDAQRMVHRRDAQQEVGRVDAALGHEPGKAAAHFFVGRPDRDDEVGVVHQVEEGGQIDPGLAHGGRAICIRKPTAGPPSFSRHASPRHASEGRAAGASEAASSPGGTPSGFHYPHRG